MLTHCFVTLKQSRKLHANNSLVRPACEKRSKLYPIACYDGRVAGFIQISEGEEAQRMQWFAAIQTGNTIPNRLETKH